MGFLGMEGKDWWYEPDGRIQRRMKFTLNEPREGWTDRYIRTPNHFDKVAVIYRDGTQGISSLSSHDPRFADGGCFYNSLEHGTVEYWRELETLP